MSIAGGSRELRDRETESDDVRASTRESNFGSSESGNDLVESVERSDVSFRPATFGATTSDSPSTCSDNVSSLPSKDVRFEDGSIFVEVVVRGEERRNLDVLDSELMTKSHDIRKFFEAFFRNVFESRS
jgi:hypothetical protein